jgi:class 3 adenylate cyclase/tetratricopeptide (TPR) repeat protein
VICPSCQTDNEPGRKFCKECATPLALACASCGSPNAPDAKFCGECASPLTASASATAPVAEHAVEVAPVAERRLVTVLFADLVGFTTLAEGRDAEDVRELLTRYFDLARDTIERYGGTVEKFIGDAVMAVWGAPTAQEDDAERAVRAALELIADVRGLGPEIDARAGVLTGEAAVTLGATDQGMVAGDIVNTAARLQSVAEPGTVLVGDSTHRAAEAAISFEPVGEASLKGKTVPVPAWRALRVVAERGGRNRAEGLEAPFVGRDEELRVLKDAFHATSREGKSRLVSIVGPAGIGKSRLAWEYSKYLDGVFETLWWHSGRSPAYGDGITFWALGEMIRRRAGLLETDDEATTRVNVAAMLETHVPDEVERRWIEPAMLTLLGIEEEGAPSPSDQLFAAWRTFFERMAATGTVMMVFEDLHWADSGTLDFIDHLLEWARDSPICIVSHARPELLEKRPTWGAGKRQFTSLYLEPLPESAMRELLQGLVPGLPDSALRAIVARADGVPLYAVETVRALVADGRLQLADGVYAPAGDLSELTVPETLTALIGARLDGLDPADRALVQAAAALGQTFTLQGLASVASEEEAELEPRLRALVRREMLVVRADPRAPDRGQYGFVQSLVREVAYNTLARGDRKRLHLAAARFYESLPTDELAGALAGQYLAAQQNAQPGDEADALAAQARLALRSAAERAVTLGAFDQAQALLEQAISVTTSDRELAELRERAGHVAAAATHYSEGEAHTEQALETYRALGDRSAAARAIAKLGQIALDGRHTESAIARLEPALAEFADLGDDPSRALLGAQLARAWMYKGEFQRSVEVADEILPIAERSDNRAVLADMLVTKGTALGPIGRPREGAMLIRGASELAAAIGRSDTELRARVNLSVFLALESPRDAWASDLEGARLARRVGYRALEITMVSNSLVTAYQIGEWDRAEEDSVTVLAMDLDPGDRVGVISQVLGIRAARGDDDVDRLTSELNGLVATLDEDLRKLYVGWIEQAMALPAGRFADAAAAFARQKTAGGLSDAPDNLGDAGRAALWAGDVAAARSSLEALNALGAHGKWIDCVRSVLAAGIAAAEGRTAEALSAYRGALRTVSEIRIDFYEALFCMDMVLLVGPGQPDVDAAAARAREILTGLRAEPYLKILDDALERAGTSSPRSGSAATTEAAATTGV